MVIAASFLIFLVVAAATSVLLISLLFLVWVVVRVVDAEDKTKQCSGIASFVGRRGGCRTRCYGDGVKSKTPEE